jgi:hypothetical protein
MFTPEQTTFRRIESSDTSRASVWLSVDLTHPNCSIVPGDPSCVVIEITPEEQAMVAAIVTRARVAFCERVNGA